MSAKVDGEQPLQQETRVEQERIPDARNASSKAGVVMALFLATCALVVSVGTDVRSPWRSSEVSQTIVLSSASGQVASLGWLHDEATGLLLKAPHNETAFVLSARAVGHSGLLMMDASGSNRVFIGLDHVGSPMIHMHDGQGNTRIAMGLANDGRPYLAAYDEHGVETGWAKPPDLP